MGSTLANQPESAWTLAAGITALNLVIVELKRIAQGPRTCSESPLVSQAHLTDSFWPIVLKKSVFPGCPRIDC